MATVRACQSGLQHGCSGKDSKGPRTATQTTAGNDRYRSGRGSTRFDDMDGTSLGVRLDAPALGPSIGLVMVSDLTDEETACGLVGNQSQVCIHTYRPEIRVFRLFDAVEVQSGRRSINLKIDYSRVQRLCVLSRQARQRGSKAIGEQKVNRGPGWRSRKMSESSRSLSYGLRMTSFQSSALGVNKASTIFTGRGDILQLEHPSIMKTDLGFLQSPQFICASFSARCSFDASLPSKNLELYLSTRSTSTTPQAFGLLYTFVFI